MKKILITGNMGYIGPVLVQHLRKCYPGTKLIGVDSGYFAHCLSTLDQLPERRLDAQIFGDVRSLPAELLEGADAVVHLAAISNDPMGNRFEAVTHEVNYRSGIAIAQAAKRAGVKSFVFASSCSVYGFAEGGPRKETDELNPLTAYARSKIDSEKALASIAQPGFTVTALRFATACGWSERIRLDLVLNDFVACAVSSGAISILSDGTPWRPLIDVQDMARAIEWAIGRDAASGDFLSLNVGSSQWNYQVLQLAEAVARIVPGTTIQVNKNAAPDKRSYRVDFSLYEKLAPRHQPQIDLEQATREIFDGLRALGFKDRNFRESSWMRLKVLNRHIEQGRLDEQLRWVGRT
ncbi:MAG TPA: SDR family oxidoreductase [Burkholderiaceae bacterium]|nr:SDR family oxidoreductase [Burkholderiaceae bacterium]